ncbi:hypothetical protein ACNOYE_31345 [Nannocystaceae bacterium ST9]
MSRYRILDEAAADLDAAMSWYEEQREGLGSELLGEFRDRVNEALEMPGRGLHSRRRGNPTLPVQTVHVATIDGVPTVLVVEHSSRLPGFWLDRLK